MRSARFPCGRYKYLRTCLPRYLRLFFGGWLRWVRRRCPQSKRGRRTVHRTRRPASAGKQSRTLQEYQIKTCRKWKYENMVLMTWRRTFSLCEFHICEPKTPKKVVLPVLPLPLATLSTRSPLWTFLRIFNKISETSEAFTNMAVRSVTHMISLSSILETSDPTWNLWPTTSIYFPFQPSLTI